MAAPGSISNPSSEVIAEKTRGKAWPDEATRTLIELWGEEGIQIALENCKTSKQTSEVYKSLLLQMKEKGFKQFELKELIIKMKKLRQKYKEVKDKKKRTGASRQKPWKFFDSMDRILSTRHNVNPPTVVDTLAENTDIVQEMVNKYGQGRVYTRKCDTCNYEKEIQTEGVHESESGALKIYSEEEEFYCPKCQSEMQENFGDEDNTVDESPRAIGEKDENEEEKDGTPTTSTGIPMKKKRKTSIEKSLEVAFQKFKEASNEEFERYQKLEDEREKREHEFRLRQMELENARRREEREHEMRVFSMLAGYTVPPTITPTSTQTADDGSTYFQL